METKQIKLSKLHKIDRNIRKHTEEQIKEYVRSFEMFGQIRPIIVDEDGMIIAGNGLYDALIRAGKDTADCYVMTGLTENEKKKLMLADNRIFELGSNDKDAFGEIIKSLDGDIDIPGWDEDLLASLDYSMDDIFKEVDSFDSCQPSDSQQEEPAEEHYSPTPPKYEPPQEIEAPEPPKEPITKPGDLWMLGRHRLLCGDATEPVDVARLMDGKLANLYLTDPPYNVDYTGKTKDALKIENDKMQDAEFRSFLFSAFAAAKHNMKSGAAFYIWHADTEGYNFRGACYDVGWQVRECLIWVKNSLVLGRQDYQWRHEPCLYGWNTGGPHSWYSDRKQTTVLEYDKPTRNAEHPTMKPVALFDYLIRNSTRPGDIVLDSFCGSGTTIIACEQDGRTGYGMELDPRYVDVIVKRWEDLTGEEAQLLTE